MSEFSNVMVLDRIKMLSLQMKTPSIQNDFSFYRRRCNSAAAFSSSSASTPVSTSSAFIKNSEYSSALALMMLGRNIALC